MAIAWKQQHEDALGPAAKVCSCVPLALACTWLQVVRYLGCRWCATLAAGGAVPMLVPAAAVPCTLQLLA